MSSQSNEKRSRKTWLSLQYACVQACNHQFNSKENKKSTASRGGSRNSIQGGHLLSFDFNNIHKIKLTHHQGRNQRFNLRWTHLISNKIKNKLIK